MPAHVKKSGQTKINVYGRGRTPLTAPEKTKLFRRFLSEAILLAFIHYKDCYNQHRHEMPLVFHVCRVLPSLCVQLPHTELPLQIIPKNILTLPYYIFAFWVNVMV